MLPWGALRTAAAAGWLALCAGLWPGAAAAQGLQPVPELTGHVVDATGTLPADRRQVLQDKLDAFEKAAGSQVVVLMVATTQPEDIAAYANRVGNAWKIGRRDVGDGVLLVVARDDRRVRIEVAKTLEGAIPDLAARQIIDEAITPAFRQGDYAGGLEAGADRIMARIRGEALPAPAAKPQGIGQSGFDLEDLAIFLFFAVPVGAAVLRSIFGRKLGALFMGGAVGAVALFITSSLLVAGLAGVVAMLVALFSSFSGVGSAARRGGGWGGGGWSSGGSGGWSGGSGGFSSGGGGDFGGGGASGDW